MTGHLTYNERRAFEDLKSRIQKPSRFLANTPMPRSETAQDWYSFLAAFKEDLGNIHIDVSFITTLMAKSFLEGRFEISDLDAAAKPQGAAGFDLEVRTKQGSRVIAEVKSTVPYKSDDLGAQQADTFRKDAEKLARTSAEHKFLFVTERRTFDVLTKPKYRGWFKGIRVVLLPSGDEIAA